MRVLTLAFLFLATLAAVNAACPTDCETCTDPTLNSCTKPNPAGGCFKPCSVLKCPQTKDCQVDHHWDLVNCQCVANTRFACPTDCMKCPDPTLNSCAKPNPAGGCFKPCSVLQCPQTQDCIVGDHWDLVNCKCVANTPAPVACPTDCMKCPDPTLNQCTKPNPAGGCIAPCTVPQCPQTEDCKIDYHWDGVNCKCVPNTPKCPKFCEQCKDTTLNQCFTVDPVTNTCVAPCTVPK